MYQMKSILIFFLLSVAEELLLIKFPDNNTYVELIVPLLSFLLNAYPFFLVLDVVI